MLFTTEPTEQSMEQFLQFSLFPTDNYHGSDMALQVKRAAGCHDIVSTQLEM